MSEPTTDAGRDMLANHGYRRPVTGTWIAEIEAEATAIERKRAEPHVVALANDLATSPQDPAADTGAPGSALDMDPSVDPDTHCPACFHGPHDLRRCPEIVGSAGGVTPEPEYCECFDPAAAETEIARLTRALAASQPSAAAAQPYSLLTADQRASLDATLTEGRNARRRGNAAASQIPLGGSAAAAQGPGIDVELAPEWLSAALHRVLSQQVSISPRPISIGACELVADALWPFIRLAARPDPDPAGAPE